MSAVMSSLKPLVAAALLACVGVANANITVYTSESAFMAALANMSAVTGTDSFDDLTAGANLGSGPLVRAAGSLGYSAAVGPNSDVFFGAGNGGDNWLSTNSASDTVTFSGFAPGVFAAGANVFNSDLGGNFLRRGAITLSADDGSSTASQTVRFPRATTFIGFISDSALTSVSLTATSGPNTTVWPTMNNLTLATAVPEPETYALMLAGLAAVSFLARRRKAD
jgi:PEP-CTERM motif